MYFKLTKEQEECLKNAQGQPVGRKGEKWMEWANSKLKRAGLSAVVVSKPGKATPSAKATVVELPTEMRTRTFVVQSGVLKSDSMTFKFDSGMLTGYFQEETETPNTTVTKKRKETPNSIKVTKKTK